jgi:nitrite reductase/ring-hydroxylating ferredoxin subunit
VLLVRHDAKCFCGQRSLARYHRLLARKIVVHDTVRCPWHHSCFDLRTGDALRVTLGEICCRTAGSTSITRRSVGAGLALPVLL